MNDIIYICNYYSIPWSITVREEKKSLVINFKNFNSFYIWSELWFPVQWKTPLKYILEEL